MFIYFFFTTFEQLRLNNGYVPYVMVKKAIVA